MRFVRRLALSLVLGSIFLAPPAFAVTNREAICAPALRCIVRPGSTPSCGSGATCDVSPQLLGICGSGITASGEGRCLTAEQQTCVADTLCVDRDVGAAPTSNPPTICCSCTNGTQQMCAQFSDITACTNFRNSQQYTLLAAETPNRVANLNCQPTLLNLSQCRPASGGGVCQAAPATLSSIMAQAAAATAPAAATTGARRAQQPAQVPALGVAIPGLTFSPASATSNFLAQYIAAIYRFAVGIALVAATVMVTYGGFRYLMGATTGDIATGKTIIKDSLIGMMLVLSAYVILNTVNPATLELHVSSLSSIREIDIDTQLNITPYDTSDPDNSEDAGVQQVEPGSHLDRYGIVHYTECPVQLDNPPIQRDPARNPRDHEFIEKFVPTVRNLPVWDCVQHVAAAAAKCDLWFGSCGATGRFINHLCGYANSQGRETHNVMGDQSIRSLLQGPCANLSNRGGEAGGAISSEAPTAAQSSVDDPLILSSHPPAKSSGDSGNNRSVQDSTYVATQTFIERRLATAMAAYDRVIRNVPGHDFNNINRGDFTTVNNLPRNRYRVDRATFEREARARIEGTIQHAASINACLHIHPPRERVLEALQNRPGWGQPWYDSLLPGDQYWIYNGNYGDIFGMHTQIFLGWVNKSRGVARTVNGGVSPHVAEFNTTLRGTGGLIVKTFTVRPRAPRQ